MEIIWWIVLIGSAGALLIIIPYMVLLFVDEIPTRPTVYVYQEKNNTPILKAAKLSRSEYNRIVRENKKAVRRDTAFW